GQAAGLSRRAGSRLLIATASSPARVAPAQMGLDDIHRGGYTHDMGKAELTEQMRGFVDLPVQDLARMCGIGRRQYYNLMRRKAETMKTAEGEQRLRLVHHYLRDLHMNLGNAAAVR